MSAALLVLALAAPAAVADVTWDKCKPIWNWRGRTYYGASNEERIHKQNPWCYLKSGGWDYVQRHTIPFFYTVSGKQCDHSYKYGLSRFWGCQNWHHNGKPWCYVRGTDRKDWEECRKPNLTPNPTPRPTPRPTSGPILRPTSGPTLRPTAMPTLRPTAMPTPRPTPRPTPKNKVWTTPCPTPRPSPRPTPRPTRRPTNRPSLRPPTGRPSRGPSHSPTLSPTGPPSVMWTSRPTAENTRAPTGAPTLPAVECSKAKTIEECNRGFCKAKGKKVLQKCKKKKCKKEFKKDFKKNPVVTTNCEASPFCMVKTSTKRGTSCVDMNL